MLEVFANLAEILAGIAIVVTAVRAWPVMTRLGVLRERSPNRRLLREDAQRVTTALEQRGHPVRAVGAKRPGDLMEDVLEALRAGDSQLHFELRDDDALPGLLRVGSKLRPFCRLSEDGYHDLLERSSERVAPGQDASAFRLSGHDDEHFYLLDRLTGTRGPAAILHAQTREYSQWTPERLRLDASHCWPRLAQALEERRGLLVIAGAIGSGKVVTFYALLNALAAGDDTKLVSIGELEEAPSPKLLAFTRASSGTNSRSELLRQAVQLNPDVVTHGLFDAEAVPVAWENYGFPSLDLGVLHARDSAAALLQFVRQLPVGARNVDAPFLVLGQVLVRRLCQNCRRPVKPDQALAERVRARLAGSAPAELRWFEPGGCASCTGGYEGHVAAHELLDVDQALLDQVSSTADHATIRALAVEGGMTTLLQDCLQLLLAGSISLEEVERMARLLGEPPIREG